MSEEEAKAEPPAIAGLVVASRMTRLGAHILDSIFHLGAIWLGFALVGMDDLFRQLVLGEIEPSLNLTMNIALMWVVTFVLLNGYLLAKRGQSLGKYMLGIAIVDHETGRIVPFTKIMGLRVILPYVAGYIPPVGLIAVVDGLFIFGDSRRCVHDYLCGTSVIEIPRKTARERGAG